MAGRPTRPRAGSGRQPGRPVNVVSALIRPSSSADGPRSLTGHGYQISPGTLYPTLHRLEADGLPVSERRVVDGGRPRCVYKATEAGKQDLPEDRPALTELAREVLSVETP
ncbi:PadR family transcriptional regulator [Streptomyces sp. H39-S7]|uniref:PadR family transcriptional regulator n=1 Tax=Streptomyces sp. H39-S7 TaxID=3004357 RepID=UPI0022BA7F0C|nr:PadR family transcriptional regulator [Streptomyces sp. H39-S7]